jgi:hypothetical protein
MEMKALSEILNMYVITNLVTEGHFTDPTTVFGQVVTDKNSSLLVSRWTHYDHYDGSFLAEE